MSQSSTPAAPKQEKKQEEEQDNTTDPLLNHRPFEPYADAEQVNEALPITSYAGLMAVYCVAFWTLILASQRRDDKDQLPPKMDWCDLAVFSLAVFHTSRTISKGWITVPLRAPFAEYQKPAEMPSEVEEKPRGKGLQRVLGELVTCPFCLGSWTGLGLGYGWVFAPRATRLLTGITAMNAVSNFLHMAYTIVGQKAQSD